MKSFFKALFILFVFMLLSSLASATTKKIKVVCTFTILADFVKQVGGDAVHVESLVGTNSDPHVFTPTPQSARTLAMAELVFVNGLGFEGWMDRLIDASGYKGKVIEATQGLTDILSISDKNNEKPQQDPHAWLTIPYALTYVKNIKEALIMVRPDLKPMIEQNYEAYKKELEALDQKIRTLMETVPLALRKVITAHDAFNYFAREYKVRFLAPQGITTDSEPSAKNVAALIRAIKTENINAVFVENISNERLIRQIAQETGVQIKGTLYTDALSQDSGPANTYIHLMEHNALLLSKAMALNG